MMSTSEDPVNGETLSLLERMERARNALINTGSTFSDVQSWLHPSGSLIINYSDAGVPRWLVMETF